VTWDPVSKRNYHLRLGLTLGAVALVVVGSLIGHVVGGCLAILGFVLVFGMRLLRRTLLPYSLPNVTHEGDYRSWVGRGLLAALGIVFVLAMILFGVMASRYH
jgi:hypothetical protein